MSKLKNKYLILFILTGILCFLVPYTGDDWGWGGTVGMQRLQKWFVGYNGRYVGNIIIMIITRSVVVKSIVMSLCLTGIVYLIEKITRSQWAFPISCFLLIMAPKPILIQGILWPSGFANYVTCIFLALIYIHHFYGFLESDISEVKIKNSAGKAIAFFLLAALSTMIVEHMTIYFVVTAIAIPVLVYIRKKRFYIQHVAYLLGALVGAVCMFSNSVYGSISRNEDFYRTAGGTLKEIINKLLVNYAFIIYNQAYFGNIVVNLFILALCIGLFAMLKAKLTLKLQILSRVCLWVITVVTFWALAFALSSVSVTNPGTSMKMESLLTILSVLATIVFILIAAAYTHNFLKILFICLSIICITAPLFLVTPIGSRCFAPTYVLFVLLVCELVNMLLCLKPELNELFPAAKKLLVTASCAALAFYVIIYANNYVADRQRLDHIRNDVANGKTEVEILHYPFESFLWCATPNGGDVWETYYKGYYDIPEDVTLIPVYCYSDQS